MSEQENREIPRMDSVAIKEFVLGYCDRQIFTLHDIHESQLQRLVGKVFMPVTFWGFKDIDPDSIGTVWEWYSKAGPQAINGYPIFMSCHIMRKEDWEICKDLIRNEMRRRDKLSLEIQEYLNFNKEDRDDDRDSRPHPAIPDPAEEERDGTQGHLRGLEDEHRGHEGGADRTDSPAAECPSTSPSDQSTGDSTPDEG